MQGVAGREHLVRVAVRSEDTDVAIFRRRQAQMYAGYHRGVARLRRFVPVAALAAAVNEQGVLVVSMPLDHLSWTREVERFATLALRPAESMEGIRGREIWLAGTISPAARRALEARGWRVVAGAG